MPSGPYETQGSELRRYCWSAGGVPGAQKPHGIEPLLQVAPPSEETPRPIPWAPPFDQRSSCHMPITWLPRTATEGSTSALRELRPPVTAIRGPFWEAQPASGETSAEARTGVVVPAKPGVVATSTSAP